MMTTVEIALGYLNRGLPVIPLWSPEILNRNPPPHYYKQLFEKIEKNKKADDPLSEDEVKQKHFIYYCKKPMLFTWKEFKSRLPTINEVTAWFTQNPTANIGIITGMLSNLIVFDLDSQDAIEYAEEQGGFPDTVKVKTAKGYHIYMKHPGFKIQNDVNHKLDIDIRSDGGYAVAPPSIHGLGHMYEWETGFSFNDIDPADCTPWMIEYLEEIAKDNKPGNKPKKSKKSDKPVESKTTSNNEYLDILKNGVSEGSRNDTATRFIGHLFKSGIDPNELWEVSVLWNSEKNDPPLDNSELRTIFNSVKDLESKNKKQDKEVSVSSLLDTTTKIVSEYDQNYIRIPFSQNRLSFLEKQMNGGLIGGRFYILGGIPSAGKTLLINNLADNVCLNGHPVLFFSYDDGVSELRCRTLSRFSEYGIEDFNKQMIEKETIKTICNNSSIKQIMNLKYVAQEMINVDKWENLIKQIHKQHKKNPVIFVDYLRKLKMEQKISDERLRIDAIISTLTDLAKKHNIPVVVISELARDSYKSGQRLSMASFKESGNIEYEASWLGILAAVEESNGEYKVKNNWETIIAQDGNIDLIVFKAKRGTGETGKIPLHMDKNKMTVEDRADSKQYEMPITTNKKSRYK